MSELIDEHAYLLEQIREKDAEIERLTADVMDFEEIVSGQDSQLRLLRKEAEELLLYRRSMESMANQFICPKMTAEELARTQLGENHD